jgi:hypothetical protein
MVGGVMSGLAFEVLAWLSGASGDAVERASLSSLRITVGSGVPATEVEDTLAQTVRSYVNVPSYFVARWLAMNWWRLRWEPHPMRPGPSYDWLSAHSMASIGGGYAWPPLQFSSDGEVVHIRLDAEATSDASAVRYLRDIRVDVSARQFERAVDRFLAEVEARTAIVVPGERELSEIREELARERSDPEEARWCKLQALAGIDPGAASEAWMKRIDSLTRVAGASSTQEIAAALPGLERGLDAADEVVTALRGSDVAVRLDWAALAPAPASAGELPWERGVRWAGELRAKLGVASGPIATSDLEELLEAKLPLERNWRGERTLAGAYRDAAGARGALLVTSPREDSQRFYLARIIGAAAISAPEEHVLAVSHAGTAFQKLQRAFAQEFLCPWRDLDAFTDESGTDDEGIAEAAEHFAVSELVVRSTLVDKGKIERRRLAS